MDSSNNSSIVCKISGLGFDSFSYLVTGDTECGRWESITRLFGRNLASQVMAAPHHGSRNGVDPKSLLLISPQVVLISAGVDNQYGHPNSQAVTAYSRVAKVYATNANRGTSFITLLDPAGKIETNPISAATSESVSAASLLRSLRGLA
jgi:beta-lactamase superfamily II metal-dependent hydrolase